MWGVLYEDIYVMMIARVAVPVTVAVVLVAAAVLGLVCKSFSGVFDGRGAGGSDGDFGNGGGAGGGGGTGGDGGWADVADADSILSYHETDSSVFQVQKALPIKQLALPLC